MTIARVAARARRREGLAHGRPICSVFELSQKLRVTARRPSSRPGRDHKAGDADQPGGRPAS